MEKANEMLEKNPELMEKVMAEGDHLIYCEIKSR